MGRQKLEIIKEAAITNNCPECFNQDMTLVFYQKHLYGRLYHRTTSVVEHKIQCNKCQSVIYPVKWTEDIERIFEYYQKTVVPEPAKITFRPLFYGIIGGIVVILFSLFYLYREGFIQF